MRFMVRAIDPASRTPKGTRRPGCGDAHANRRTSTLDLKTSVLVGGGGPSRNTLTLPSKVSTPRSGGGGRRRTGEGGGQHLSNMCFPPALPPSLSVLKEVEALVTRLTPRTSLLTPWTNLPRG